jgi:RNA polymerase sigma factor (sigma-70 family)
MDGDTAEREFVERLERHRGLLVKVAGAYCREDEQREDLVQDIVVQLWSSRKRFDGRVTFSTWMYRVALNVAISAYRRKANQAAALDLDFSVVESLAAPVAAPDPEREVLFDRIDRLDPLHRALLLLYLEERSYAEIGEILGISESNVGTKIARIKHRLRHEIAAAPIV